MCEHEIECAWEGRGWCGQAMECTSGGGRGLGVRADRKVFISPNKLCVKSAQK